MYGDQLFDIFFFFLICTVLFLFFQIIQPIIILVYKVAGSGTKTKITGSGTGTSKIFGTYIMC